MTRILTSLERWRYSIGIITSTTLIAQLLTNGGISPSIEPIEGMGECKAAIRTLDAELSDKEEIIDIQQRKLDEERAKVTELQNNVDRLESEVNRNISAQSKRSTDGGGGTLNVEASFYTAFCPTGCIGITATGIDVRNTIYTPEGYRVIAVDPSVIKLGSIVKVTLADGDSFEAKAADTGGDIRGNRIDILVESTDEAFSLGRQSASIEIISEGKR